MWKWIGGANTADSLGQPGPIDFPGVGYFPSARAGHAILIHTELNAMYVYGGTQGKCELLLFYCSPISFKTVTCGAIIL